jgi:FkbM family methyltransferase
VTLQSIQAGLLRSPDLESAYSVLKGVPGLGSALHSAVQLLFPRDKDVVVRIPAGIAAGMAIQVDPRFHTAQARGGHQACIQQLLLKLLQPGDFFCEVGTDIGFLTLGAARLVSESGRVLALEPDRNNFRRLVRNVDLNGLVHVRTLNFAAQGRSRRRKFLSCAAGGGEEAVRSAVLPVAAGPLDEVVIRPPDLIKIDVAGGEAEVLRGARAIMQKRSSAWVIEAHGPGQLSEVVGLLSGFGYAPRVVREEASAELGDRYLVVARP